jgi:hypothetical protein
MTWYQANKARLASHRRLKRQHALVNRLSEDAQMAYAWQGSPLIESFPHQPVREEEGDTFLDFLIEAETD